MQHSNKIKLISKFNNKINSPNSNVFFINQSKNVQKLLEILYLEGQILSYRKLDNKYLIILNNLLNDNKDKIKNLTYKHVSSVKYSDLIKMKSLLRTVYFHTTHGLLSLETLKSKKLGGVPLFKI